jgi:serine/threonine-protein phosphatase 2B catalytic subunit
MLIAILNCCTKEELEEEEEEEIAVPEALSPVEDDMEEGTDSSKMKNKIMLVGKMSRVFALLR